MAKNKKKRKENNKRNILLQVKNPIIKNHAQREMKDTNHKKMVKTRWGDDGG